MANVTNLYQTRGSGRAQSIVIAVGGGKGGVGKSFLSSNLAIFLANMGFNTVIVDLDLGAPNLHSCLGEEPPKKTFHDYLRGNVLNFEEVAVATRIPKLRLITGANDHTELADINMHDQSKLMAAIYGHKADFTVLDLSAGTHNSTLDFFLMAERHLVTLTPDPTSIENAYRFMKAVFFRKIKRFERQLGLDSRIGELMSNAEQNKIKFPADLMQNLIKTDPTRGMQLKHMMDQLDFQLVLNQTRSLKDIQLGYSIEAVCKKYFGLRSQFLGHLDYDNAAWHSLRKRRPLLLEYPQSPLYSQILGIARDLASPHIKKAAI